MSSDAAKIYRQQADDSQYSWRSMTTQLAINAGISVCVLIAFNMLRPSYTRNYIYFFRKTE
jgi:hypothetical protein